jgi:hypothetical protein
MIIIRSDNKQNKRTGLVIVTSKVTHIVLLTFIIFLSSLASVLTTNAQAGIHHAPVIIQAYKVKQVASHPVEMYRLFRSDKNGKAVPIPFQIDEINEYTDFILPNGPQNNTLTSNGIFDRRDELSFMGTDVGPRRPPTIWDKKTERPPILYEISISTPQIVGAVYVGVYFSNPPTISSKSYVVFDQKNAEVTTSRFRYKFDRNNYLVVRGIDLNKRDGSTRPIIDSSTFYLKADLKYFLTVEVNHNSMQSEIEAYKSGPIRTIVRVKFSYSMLRLKFDLGMYTEVSFFSNAVFLPAIMYNPLDSEKSLNKGSGFYYGFNFVENPKKLNLKTNMPPFKKKTILDLFSGEQKVKPSYQVTAESNDYMIYMQITPSQQMRRSGNAPMLYQEDKNSTELTQRVNKKPLPLGSAPVNMAMYFDISKFSEGEHIVSFNLFFENLQNKQRLEEFKRLSYWSFDTKRI